ncbi:MAG: DUF1080 domain-containing protein [Flammeovirgaceae bacterium]|nr:DUF1080 domain-containing protein [Flammeovirgaceae bacterium]
MNKLFFLIFTLLISNLLIGQDRKVPPEATEIWEPVPRKVDPGADNATPPSDAVVLFGGKDLSEWESATEEGGDAKWEVKDGIFTVVAKTGAIKTKKEFGSCQLHIEWRSPQEIVGEGQGRGNSGIFLMSKYEVQVLDSYESKTYSNGQAASIYKQSIPLVNAMRPTTEWEVYDIIFNAPKFNKDGILKSPASVTIFHNGVLVQNNFELKGPTEYNRIPIYEPHADKMPIILQDHGNPVSFRNIWIRDIE